MARTKDPRYPLPLLDDANAALAAAWEPAGRRLAPLLKKLGAAGLARERALATRVPGGMVSHVPTVLPKPVRYAELFERTHAVGALQTTRSLVSRVTQTTLLPGTYLVSLRPAGRETLAFDFLAPNGDRVFGTVAHAKMQQQVPPGISIRFLGIDVDIDPPDDILNPFKHLICVSFLHWRTCFEVPTWIWPK